MEQWIYESLSNVLGEELSEDLTQYILSVNNEADFEDYMKDLFDFSDKDQRNLYENIKAAKFESKKNPQNNTKLKISNINNTSQKLTQNVAQSSAVLEPGKKKSKKFRKFQLSELQKGYLKEGRNPCECQASVHKLINNCIECGRIVCEQEGSGPCFFCDNMVCTKEELEILNSDTKEADSLYRTLNDRKKSDTWKKAIQSRNKLLDYDKAVTQHTKIIDDEHDYFEVNNRWLSKKEREKAAKKLEKDQEHKHGSRLGARKIVLDILGKKAIDDTSFNSANDLSDEEESSLTEGRRYSYKPYIPDIDALLESFKTDKVNFKEKKPEMSSQSSSNTKNASNELIKENYVIQDKTYLEMSDKGVCLSMHQPWASLLVLGIKKHEGRSWYTPHRGMLWIASTAKPADPDIVKEVESFYKSYYDGITVKFPDKYPTGCLVGNVLVQDCLSQEEYREVYPSGESDSPYVWICSDPQKLIVPIPIKGQHKIYKLNPEIHVMARDALILKRRFAR